MLWRRALSDLDTFDQAPMAATPTAFSTTMPLPSFDQLLSIPPGDSPSMTDDVLKQRQAELRQGLATRITALEKAERQMKRS